MRKTDQKPSITFFGTDDFAQSVLEALKKAGFTMVLKGGELGVVASYGKILPRTVLGKFAHGILNVHPSLLPKYRGPSPIQYAILNGDAETGVTIMKMDEQVDHGVIVANKELRIMNSETNSQLRNRLARLGAELLVKTIPDYAAGNIQLREQDHSKATYTKMLTRDDGKVDLETDPPEVIYRKFLAFEGWPGIWFTHKRKRVKIIGCEIENLKLKILTLQPEGRRPMSLIEFENGYGKLRA